MGPAILVDSHAAPCVYPSGVWTTCSNVDQPMIVPLAVSFSKMGTTVFSLSSEYDAQFARGTLNWLTNVYTVGVGSICGRAAGTRITANTITSRPAIRFNMMMSSWTLSLLAGRAAQHVGSSLCVPHLADFAWGGRDAAFALLWSTWEKWLAPGVPTSVRRQYAPTFPLSSK